MFNEVVYLITEYGKSYDEDGFEVGQQTIRKKVFASIKSTTYKEYYEASRIDEKVSDIFVVSDYDYNSAICENNGKKLKPSLIEYDGQLYHIRRRYRSNRNGNWVIELTCSEVE